MYVWRNKNRRDRREHALTNPFEPPLPNDVRDYKAWYQQTRKKVSTS
jgi:hypothetical protein